MSKNELIFYFRGQNETEYNRISILLRQRIPVTFKNITENKAKNTPKTNSKEEIEKRFRRRQNKTAQREKDESCT